MRRAWLRRHRRPALLAGLAVIALTGTPPTGAAAARVTAPDVPDAIRAPSGHKPFLLTHAVGVQIYTCAATADGPAWQLVAPRATLYGDAGQRVGTHFGGPKWQARDGSAVTARRVDGVTVEAGAIPWLLLEATATTAGFDGDRLAGTTFIQRIATAGGLAPPAGACRPDTLDSRREIPYTADYRFWKRHPA